MRRLVLVIGIVLAGCGGGSSGSDPPPVATNVSAIVPRDARPTPDASPRIDLSTLPNPLPASILPAPGAKVTTTTQVLRDADGLAYKGSVVEIEGGGAPALRLTSGRERDLVATTIEDELGNNRRSLHPMKLEGRTEVDSGAWAVSYRAPDGQCQVTGWAPKAHVACTSQGSLACTDAPALLTICTTLEPAGTFAEPAGDPALTFFQVKDPKAVEVMAAAARAIARNDRDAIVATVGPRGVLLKGKQVSRAGLRKLLATDTVQRAFEIDCKVPALHVGPTCTWMTEGVGAAEIDVIPRELGDDVIPRITFARAADGAWWLAKVDLLDPRETR